MSREQIIQELTPAVSRNALISDARYWGYYSMCGVLLRLREQYRFEMQIPLWAPLEERGVADWIGQREALWQEAGSADFVPLTLAGKAFDPFDVEGINARVRNVSLVYGAGYGLHMKPVFFLAELTESRSENGLSVHICGREYARDMSMNPAMVQEQVIYARRSVMENLLWGKFEECRAGKKPGLLEHAFRAYGVEKVMEPAVLEAIAADEIKAIIRHEHGEAAESERLGTAWVEMLGQAGHPRAGLILRSLKDILADTCDEGMLRYIIEGRLRGPLAFFLSFLEGYRRGLASGIRHAVADFGDEFSWEAVNRARLKTWKMADECASRLLAAWSESGQERFQSELERAIQLAEGARHSA